MWTSVVFFEKITGLDLLLIVAHPFRPSREISRLGSAFFHRFHAIGLNARDLFFFGNNQQEQTIVFSKTHNIPVVAGSDTHHYEQLGSVFNTFKEPLETVADLKRLIAARAYYLTVDREIQSRVARARKMKQTIKFGSDRILQFRS